MAKKKLTILHSNDMHGDFLPEIVDGKEVGGLARIDGYVEKVREEEERVIYAIAGDMFRGSVIDSEYLGLSTIDLINHLEPDVATIGNHEVDYGLAHLLFLEKCAKFPIINANLFITLNSARLFSPYKIVNANGVRVLFIGIITNEVIASTKSEKIIGSFVDINQAAKEVGIICDNYKTSQIDLTVLLTHIGLEEDIKLAKALNPSLGVDLIIGGHSHTFMDEPMVVNGIPIVQAGTGTNLIGRFDIEVETRTDSIVNYTWKCVEINEDTAPEDYVTKELLNRYKSKTDDKYKRVVTNFKRELTHPDRYQETELGNLYADIMQNDSSFDIMMFGSGSIRKEKMGPIVEYQDMIEMTPYDDEVWMVKVTGKQFKQIVKHMLRPEAFTGHTEFYQFSKGVKIKYDKTNMKLLKLEYNGKSVKDDDELTIALQNFHYQNFDEFMGVPLSEVSENMKPRVVVTSCNNVIEEYFNTHQNIDSHIEGRIEIVE